MNTTSSVPAPFVEGLAKPPACNSPPPANDAEQAPCSQGPLWNSTQQLEWQSHGLVRAAGPAQLCD